GLMTEDAFYAAATPFAVAADATNSGSESTSGTRHGVGRARFSRNDVFRAFAYVCTQPNRW
ncbi:hypothetical protein, partial [Enterococcus faecalis]|uniref:hypothetical protein n=1 Tax=Enterococcus faecalis TaxID=1351 RepID=UPI003B7F0805